MKVRLGIKKGLTLFSLDLGSHFSHLDSRLALESISASPDFGLKNDDLQNFPSIRLDQLIAWLKLFFIFLYIRRKWELIKCQFVNHR